MRSSNKPHVFYLIVIIFIILAIMSLENNVKTLLSSADIGQTER
jgi:hypothetical protein